MQTSDGNKILIKRSKIYSNVPNLSSLSLGELAINTYDGKIFARTETENLTSVKTFLNSEYEPYVYNDSLSGVIPKNGGNNTSGVSSNILGGYDNDISGATSSIVNGENNNIESDFSLIGDGENNKISNGADYSAILGGQNNLVSHQNSFTIGSNLSSHAENFTYINNLSVIGKIYGDGSDLLGITGGSGSGDENVNTLVRTSSADWNIIGDRYFTTSVTTHSINKGVKAFIVDAGLSYIPTQDITIVHDHDIGNHMHGTVLDYNSFTGSLTADITSRTGSGTYSDWRINLGGTPAFVNSLVSSNNLSDVSNPSVALANLSGVSRSELQSLSANLSTIKKFDMVYSPNTISYSGIAPSGSLTSQSVWTITRITYTTSGTVSAQGVASNVIWNNRTSLSYV